MAQSSTSFNYTWTYDVFLNFRGEDTRIGFVGNLYKALCDKGIRTFIDDIDLERGEDIRPTLFDAINDSRIAITVFSKNYAQSTFCLAELVRILKCIKQKGRLVLPVFYDIDPSIVRHSKQSYGEALAKHEQGFSHDKEIVRTWKSALRQASNMSGWHFKLGSEYEFQFIERIVKEVSTKINRVPLHITKYPVGLDSRVQKVFSLIDFESDDGVNMVGIYGIPGSGKTTIARALYNLIADSFESICFLGDIKFNAWKHGLTYLQEMLLSKLVGEKDIKLNDISEGIPIIKRRLCRKRVLLILDNVDKLEQLHAIVGEHDWFGSGSTIIITTRDKHLLNVHDIKRQYEAELINHEEALELLCWNAFKSNQAHPIYKDVSRRVVHYCKGLPIALEIIGSNLFGKSQDEWNSALDTYRKIPNKNVQEILRASYEALDEKEKEIFLDIACFFKGQNLEDVKNILSNGRGFQPNYSIGVLVEKSLIKVENSFVKVEKEIVTMHDLIEDMGKEIVRQQSTLEPGKRSRLWLNEDIIHVLEENTGTDEIEIIILHFPKTKEVRWNGKAFKKMKNLKILIIRNVHFSKAPKYLPDSLRVLDWQEYPSSSLPSSFHPDKLVQLDLVNSSFILDETLKNFMSMKEMNLSNCELIEKVPDISRVPNLTKLNLSGCRNLIEVNDSVGFLGKLKLLNASRCTKLRIFPNVIKSRHLENLDLTGCSSLVSFPNAFGILEYIDYIFLEQKRSWNDLQLGLPNMSLRPQCLSCSNSMVPKIEKLMESFKRLNKCQDQSLFVQDCSLLDKNHSAWLGFFADFRKLYLFLSNVTHEHLVKGLPLFPNLELLDLSDTDITIIPECIKECCFLTTLYLNRCKLLKEIRGVPPNIKTLSALGCTSLSTQFASILFNEALHECGGTFFTLPGVRIPEWFDYCACQSSFIWGSSLSFWFRNKFPEIALCFIVNSTINHTWEVSINGKKQVVHFSGGCEVLPALGHMSLFDLQGKCKLGNEGGAEFMQDRWNYVEITVFSKNQYPYLESQERSFHDELSGGIEIGVYVYKKRTSVRDVQFPNPILPKGYLALHKRKQPES